MTQQLLTEQAQLVKRVLSLNLEIASRLGREPSRSYPGESLVLGNSTTFASSGSDVKHMQNTFMELLGDGRQSPAESVHDALDNGLSQPLLATPSSQDDRKLSQNYSTYFFPHPHVEGIRDTVSQCVKAKQYNVEDFYKESGLFQAMARNEYFKHLAMIMIAVNVVWIGFETDYNKASVICKAPLAIQFVDNAFCTYFTLELLIRFMAFKMKRNVLSDGWFMFDALLVVFMCWETWLLVALYLFFGVNVEGFGRAPNVLRSFRLIRLARVARAARLLNAAPEMLILAKGIFSAIRSVIAVMCLLLLVVYVFAVMFTQLLSGTAAGAGRFDSVPQAVNSLVLAVICGPEAGMLDALLAEGMTYYLLFVVFVLLALFTIMNMLIGILVGVVGDVREHDKAEQLEEDLEREIARLATMVDTDNSGTISKEDFDSILTDCEITYNFHCLGVDIASAADFAKHIFAHMDEISLADFRHLVVQFRRDKCVTAKDIMAMRKFISMEMLWLEERLKSEK